MNVVDRCRRNLDEALRTLAEIARDPYVTAATREKALSTLRRYLEAAAPAGKRPS